MDAAIKEILRESCTHDRRKRAKDCRYCAKRVLDRVVAELNRIAFRTVTTKGT